MIHQLRDHYSIVEICDALEISRSGYYKRLGRRQSDREKENDLLLKEMKAIHQESFKRAYGSPRMTTELRQRGRPCSENRVARLMAESSIQNGLSTKDNPSES